MVAPLLRVDSSPTIHDVAAGIGYGGGARRIQPWWCKVTMEEMAAVGGEGGWRVLKIIQKFYLICFMFKIEWEE